MKKYYSFSDIIKIHLLFFLNFLEICIEIFLTVYHVNKSSNGNTNLFIGVFKYYPLKQNIHKTNNITRKSIYY